MALICLTSATSEPVTLDDLKHHLRLSTTDTAEDVLLNNLIVVSRTMAENYMKRQILPAQWRLILEDFPGTTGIIELPRPPLSTVVCKDVATGVTITYIKDTTIADDSTTVGATVFAIDMVSQPGRIYPTYGNEWPSCVTDEKKDAVQITYISGATVVPEPIKVWIMMKTGALYENREGIVETQQFRTLQPLGHEWFNGLLDPYIILDMS